MFEKQKVTGSIPVVGTVRLTKCVKLWYTLHMKVCNKCREPKNIDCFGKNRRNKDGLMYQCKECNNARVTAYNREYVNGTKEAQEYNANRRYLRHGITKEIFLATLEEQDGCAICHTREGRLSIDHDHEHCPDTWGCAQCFRGILCAKCNSALGLFSEDQSKMQNAIRYLAR